MDFVLLWVTFGALTRLFNLAIVTFRTPLVVNLFGEGPAVHVAFFSTAMLLMAS